MTVADMTERMTERELGAWRTYARTRGLPSFRLRAQVAMVALCVAQSTGTKNITLDDFLIQYREPEPEPKRQTAREGAAAIGAMAGAGVVRLGLKRKRGG